MTVICPKCRKPVEIDDCLPRCIESIRKVGCDDCLRKLAHEVVPEPAKLKLVLAG